MLPKQIQVFKGWDPESEPTLVPYEETNKFEELADKIIKVLKLEGISINDLKLSATNPLISEFDKTKTLQEHGVTSSSLFYANVNNPNFGKRKITPLFQLIEADKKGMSSHDYDQQQKFMIIYGLAASLYEIHKSDNLKINISPKYIFVDGDHDLFLDHEKLKFDSENQDPKDFVILNAKYKLFIPDEVIEQGCPSEDSEIRMKGDVYTFGSICFAIFNSTLDFDINEERSKEIDPLGIPVSVQTMVKSCWSRDPNDRPTFSDILQIMSQQIFIDDIGNVDIEKFKNYQASVVDKQFITDLKINFTFDLTKIPKVQIRNREDFQIIKQIGRGGFGCVFLATDKKNNQKVAYKQINTPTNEEQTTNQIRTYREIEILAATNNPAVQKLYGIIIGEADDEKNPTVIMTPYESNGGLDKIIAKKRLARYDFTQKYIVMYGVAAGMYYLHKKNIIHRDIKAENILMNGDFEPVITDFGLSKQVQDPTNLFQSMVSTGSVLYMAPELLDTNGCDNFALYDARLSDVYAFGNLVYYIFTGKRPYFECTNANTVMHKIINGQLPTLPSNFPHVLGLLVSACGSRDPMNRPTFEEILKIIGNPSFIQHVGNVDMERFEKYQEKVVFDKSLIIKSNEDSKIEETDETFNIPEIPENQKRLREDFQLTSEPSEDNHPFFITADLVELDKNDKYNYIKLKREVFEEPEFLKHFTTMLQSMYTLNHPSINHPYAFINGGYKVAFKEDADSIYDIFPRSKRVSPMVIFPTMENENLKQYLSNIKNDLTMTQKFIILYGIAAGMYYMHKNKIAHLNLNPNNILLNSQMQPIINLDITSRPKSCKENLFYLLPAFSFPYVAPELLDFKDIQTNTELDEESSDVYSFAMIAYFLFSRIEPWNSCRGYQSILLKTLNNERPLIANFVPYPFNKLIEDCWYTNPLLRPKFKTILMRIGSSNFIRSIESIDIEKFKEYQKTVVDQEYILPIQLYSIRTRDEFIVDKIIGSGMFGNVKLATDKTNNNKVAFKEIPENEQNSNQKLVAREISILSSIQFPSIVSLYGIIEPNESNKETIVILPFAQNADLEKLISKENKGIKSRDWTFTQKCIVMYGIAMGMYKLHEKDVIHRDLKPQNVLINNEYEPWITDFELSKFVDVNQTMFQSMTVGTPAYMAPEAFEEKDEEGKIKYDGKLADVYSFGVLVYFLMTGMQPWSNIKNQFTLMTKIMNGERPSIPDTVSENFKSLIESCWDKDPIKRPSFKEIVEIISDPDFYQNCNHNFNDLLFYKYQVKLGELSFIKYSDEEIKEFYEKSDEPISINRNKIANSIRGNSQTSVKSLVSEGKPENIYMYGCMLRDGNGVPKDEENAVFYFKQASDQNYIDATVAYALCLKEGKGIEKNEDEALRLMCLAAEKDNIEAQVILASWYTKMRPRKYGLAYDLLKKAEKHPDAPAMIGSLMEKRKLGAIPDKEEIMNLYKKSCDMASPEGMYHMATIYHYGKGILKPNTKEAVRLYNLSAMNANANQGPSILSLSILYEEMNDGANAFSTADYYRSQDMFEGYLRCAELYRKGFGVEKDDQKADECLKIASEKRFAQEQMITGLIFSRGKGVQRDKEKAYYWTDIAAKNGSPQAQANLAFYYLEAYGCQQNLEEAEKWAKMGADQGNDHAMNILAKVYKKKGDEANEFKYLEMSAKLGNERALVDLGKKYKERKRNSEAIKCFKEAAESRVPMGLFLYGKELMSGKREQKNEAEGLNMIEDAAKMGCKDALKKVISLYTNGENGVQKNEEKVKYYQDMLDKMSKNASK